MRIQPLPTLALAAVLTAGCTVHLGAPTDDTRRAAGPGGEAAPFEWSGRLAPGSTFEVRGVNGPVRVEPSAGDRAEGRAVRTARRDDPAAAEVRVVEHARGVIVCTVMPAERDRMRGCERTARLQGTSDIRVEYTVRLPAGVHLAASTVNGPVTSTDVDADVRARTTNGDVRVAGARTTRASTTNGSISVSADGSISASTTNGSISATLLRGMESGSTELRTTNGSISLTLPAGMDASIRASTSNGRVSTELPLRVQGVVSRRSLAGQLGEGGPEIRLRTTNGSISLKRGAAAPRRLEL
jgi:hypothetical protein